MRPLEQLLDRLERVRRSGTGWTARCPAHEDARSSLSISEGEDGRALLHCFAGCTVEAILAAVGLEVADLFPEKEARQVAAPARRQAAQVDQVLRLVAVDGKPVDPGKGLTIEELAEAKCLPTEFLQRLGVETVPYFGAPTVLIPYHDEQGELVAVRYRHSLDGEVKFRWRKGTKAATLLYAANRLHLAREAGYVVLVEGESDCWTLLHHGFPALGLPGASMFSEAHAARLDGIATIFVLAEPDQGGEQLLATLRRSSVRPRVRVVRLATKDASELHIADEAAFRFRFREAMEQATTLLDIEQERRLKIAAAEWEQCKVLAAEPDILGVFAARLRERGFVGPTETAKLVYLVLTSRLLRRPVSLVLRGSSSAGKSYNVESVLPFFPASAYLDRSAMSERTLVYSDESFEHRMIYLPEAEAIAAEGLGAYFLRTLVSENRLIYETVEKDAGRLVTRVIEKPGPVGVILTTTRLRLHAENETRMLALTVPDDPMLTRGIMRAIAQRDDETLEEKPPEAWRSLQRWLELVGERRVLAEHDFLLALAEAVPTVAVRLRRDFALIRSLVFAHAILHQATRRRDDRGRIIATLDDYSAVRALIVDIVAEGIGASVSSDVRETVGAVAELISSSADATATRRQVADALHLDTRATNRRLAQAVEAGFLRNENSGRGKTALYALGDPIPEDLDVLPDSADLRRSLNLDHLDDLAPASGDQHPSPAGGPQGFVAAAIPEQLTVDEYIAHTRRDVGGPDTGSLEIAINDPAWIAAALEEGLIANIWSILA